MKNPFVFSIVLISFFLSSAIFQGTYVSPKTAFQKSPVNSTLQSGITSVKTSTAVFVGYSQKAIHQNRPATNKALRVTSFSAYEDMYGGPTSGYYLWESVQLFFENGGQECFIISVASTSEPIQKNDLVRGLKISKSVDAQLLLIPDAVGLAATDFYEVQENMIHQCGQLKDRFAILSTQAPSNQIVQDFETYRAHTHARDLSRAAVYYPWVISTAGTQEPPSGAVAGVYAYVDDATGVWKAPANVSLRGVSGLTQALSQKDLGLANVDAQTGISINGIKKFAGRGILVWGARTLAGNSNEWRYVPVRRLAIMLENSIQEGLKWTRSEPNDADLWTKIEVEIETYMQGLFREGAFAGTKNRDAYFVKCGLGKTMTAQDVSAGRLKLEIGIAPTRPAEFIVLRMEIDMEP